MDETLKGQQFVVGAFSKIKPTTKKTIPSTKCLAFFILIQHNMFFNILLFWQRLALVRAVGACYFVKSHWTTLTEYKNVHIYYACLTCHVIVSCSLSTLDIPTRPPAPYTSSWTVWPSNDFMNDILSSPRPPPPGQSTGPGWWGHESSDAAVTWEQE